MGAGPDGPRSAGPDLEPRGAAAGRACVAGQPLPGADPGGGRSAAQRRVVGVRASRAGAVVTTRYETRIGETLAAVSASVSILRGVAVGGPERPEPEAPPWPVFAAAGEPKTILTPRGFPHLYSECAEIWNPIHTERAVALAAGLDDILIHGTALWALAGLALTPAGGRLTRLAARFRSPAWAGEPMALRTGVADHGPTAFQLTAADGRLLCEGFAELDGGDCRN